MSTRKQQKIAGTLLNQALHSLGELNIPYCLIIEGAEQLFTNVAPRHAKAILEDAAQFSITLRDKTIEAKVERLIDGGEWGKSEA